jgi:hypothetical protein
MRNRHGFIPARYRQPDYYRLIINNWVAVYAIGDAEYHVQLESDWRNRETARSMTILRQEPTRRNILQSDIPSVKQAMEKLEELLAGQDGKECHAAPDGDCLACGGSLSEPAADAGEDDKLFCAVHGKYVAEDGYCPEFNR